MAASLTQMARRNGSAEDKAASRRLELVRQLSEEFQARNDIYEAIDQIVYMQHQVKIPAAWEQFALEVKAPLALRTVNTITAALTVNTPATHFEPVRLGTAGESNATAREHFFDAAWARQEDEADRQLFRIWMHHLVTHGSSWMKTLECSKTAWAQYYKNSNALAKELDEGHYSETDRREKYDRGTEELKRRASYPIMTTVPSPANMFYIPTDQGFSFVSEVNDVPYYEALARFGAGISRTGRIVPEAEGLPVEEWSHAMSGVRNIRKIECWEWDRAYYYLCDPGGGMNTARLVKSVRHGYGNALTHTLRGPYFHANGVTTSSNDHRYAGISVVFGFLYLYPLFDAMLTGMAEGAAQWSWPFLGSDRPPQFPELTEQGLTRLAGPDGRPIESTLQLQPGSVLPNGLRFIDPPRVGMDMRAFMEQVKALLELALPSVVQGIVGQDQSGYAISQASYLARLEWDPIVKQAERALSRRVGFESWLIENRIRERVYAWGDLPTSGPFASSRAGYLSLGPEDLSGAHRYNVRLEPETPSNRTIDLRSHAEMVAQRFESWEDAVEAMGNSPSEVELAWLLQDVKHDPRATGKILDRTFALIAIREEQEKAAAQLDILDALGGGIPPPGAPPGAGLGPTQGQVYMPGQNGVPLTPTPAGTGAGAPGGGPVTGLGPGPTFGMPVVPNPPANPPLQGP